ncbi:MAG: phenylacetate--CoA ligase family protein [Burkholderiales bacterium]|nr:phenylacetate--CoA ligase family protein [Burkholderiales bacterium]
MHADPIPPHQGLPSVPDWGTALRPAGPFDPWQSFNAACDVWSGGHADAAGLARRRAWRLRDLLESACAAPLHAARLRAAGGASIGDPGRSPRAAQRAAALPLESIEPIGRAQTLARFDEACTDRAVTLERVRAFIADPSRIGEAFLGRYAVWTSSGTTGSPAIWLHDTRALAVYDALETLRFGGFDRPGRGADWLGDWVRTPAGSGGRYAMVGATGGHFAGVASVERLRRLWPWAGASMRTVSILQPLRALCAELDAFAPSVVATYPTAAGLLAAEQRAGRLHIRPHELWLGGEPLSDAVRREVADAFDCRVRETYGASECMAIAWECTHGALHVNADWVVLEPVDRDMRPVPPGTASHTVLLTNLANRVQPILRHDLGDSVTVDAAPCPCGSPMPTLRVEGRRDDVLVLEGIDGPVRLLPLALVTVMEDEAGVFDFQLVARDAGTLLLRLPPSSDPGARPACHRALRAFLDTQGLATVRVLDDPRAPAHEAASGKLRRVASGPGR